MDYLTSQTIFWEFFNRLHILHLFFIRKFPSTIYKKKIFLLQIDKFVFKFPKLKNKIKNIFFSFNQNANYNFSNEKIKKMQKYIFYESAIPNLKRCMKCKFTWKRNCIFSTKKKGNFLIYLLFGNIGMSMLDTWERRLTSSSELFKNSKSSNGTFVTLSYRFSSPPVLSGLLPSPFATF